MWTHSFAFKSLLLGGLHCTPNLCVQKAKRVGFKLHLVRIGGAQVLRIACRDSPFAGTAKLGIDIFVPVSFGVVTVLIA